MRAIDTNVVVRFLTGDHPDQSARARRLIGGGDIFVATSVLLEIEWVLRSVYRYPPATIVKGLRDVAGTEGVSVEDGALLARALDWTEQGLDFADALHLARGVGCDSFHSFDRDFVQVASALVDLPVKEP